MKAFALPVLAIAVMVLSACAAPVGVARVDPVTVQRNLTASAVSAARPTTFSRNVLHEQDLFELFQDDPEAALGQLHDIAVTRKRGTWRELFALAELSFLHADAHLDGVESEVVVRSGHSVQANPAAINEVRRILLLHLSAPSNDKVQPLSGTPAK